MRGRRTVRLGAILLTVGALIAATPLAAAADEPDTTGPGSTAATTAAERQQLQDLAVEIARLEAAADQQGEAAQKADEQYLDAQADADEARLALTAARAAAEEATETARDSRARASVIASQLARTDLDTLPLDLLLNGPSADQVLGGLSSTGQLSAQADALFKRAASDARRAGDARRESERAALDADHAAHGARKAYRAAKRDARAAEEAVESAEAREAALIQQLAAADETDLGDVCGSLGAPPSACTFPETPTTSTGGSKGERAVAFARAQAGEPYVFAAAGPSAWDCSGLTLGAWQSVGVTIGIHSATAQYNTAAQAGQLVPVADARPGDLLFYSDGSGSMYHTTMYSGGGSMIEAPYPGQVVREVPIRTVDLVAQAVRPA